MDALFWLGLAFVVLLGLSFFSSETGFSIGGKTCELLKPKFGSINCEVTSVNVGVSEGVLQSKLTGVYGNSFEALDTSIENAFSKSQPELLSCIHNKYHDFNAKLTELPRFGGYDECWFKFEVLSGNEAKQKIVVDSSGKVRSSLSNIYSLDAMSCVQGQQLKLYAEVCGYNLNTKWDAVPISYNFQYDKLQWVQYYDSVNAVPVASSDGCVNQDLLKKIKDRENQATDSGTGVLNDIVVSLKEDLDIPSDLDYLNDLPPSLDENGKPLTVNGVPAGRDGEVYPFIQEWVNAPTYKTLTKFNGQDAIVLVTKDVYSVKEVDTEGSSCYAAPDKFLGRAECFSNEECQLLKGASYSCDNAGSEPSFTCVQEKQCESDIECTYLGYQTSCKAGTKQGGACVQGICQYQQEKVACCPTEVSCSANEFCSAESYTCEQVTQPKLECNFECCVNEQGFKDKACGSGLECQNNVCRAPCEGGTYYNGELGYCVAEPVCDPKTEALDTSKGTHECLPKQAVVDYTLLLIIGVIVLGVLGYTAMTQKRGRKR